MRITFIGSGVMGEAILQGILDKGLVEAGDVRASDISAERRSYIKDKYGVDTSTDNRSAVEKADLIILAVKPVSLSEVMKQLKGCIDPGQLVISIVAGAKVDRICQGLDHRKVIRAMPNMPAQIREGVTVWTASNEVGEEDRQRAGTILRALGVEIFCRDEHYIDMSTAVSGSGPAYVFTVIESLIDGAVQIGLPHNLAREMVLQTVSGATLKHWQSVLTNTTGDTTGVLWASGVIVDIDALFPQDTISVELSDTYLNRLKQITNSDIDKMMRLPVRASVCAAGYIVQCDEFFPNERFDRQAFDGAMRDLVDSESTQL